MHRSIVHQGVRAALLICFASAASAPAGAQTLELGGLTAERDEAGWRFIAAFEGSADLALAVIYSPDPETSAGLPCESVGPDLVECLFESPPFDSLADLLAVYPAGDYTLALNRGTRTAVLPFDPVEPDGVVTVSAPADGASGISGTPAIVYTHDCTMCNVLSFEITNSGEPTLIGLEILVFGDPLPSAGTVPYAALESFEGPKPSVLPAGSYALLAATAVGAIEEATLTPGGAPFEYATGALIGTYTTFTVPEPAALSAAFASLGALGALAGVRRRTGEPAARRPRARAHSAASTAAVVAEPLGSGISVSV
jgi:hypothetical protein